jgi:short-subunit dehydrogenase
MIETNNYIITGATSEIGQALSNRLINNGCKVILVSRKKQTIVESDNIKILDRIDLTNANHLRKVYDSIHENFQSEFSLIHSVGDFWEHKALCSTSLDEAVKLINSHYITLFGILKTVIPVMKSVGGGRIVAFSCNSVKYNYPDMAAFTSAKAAVECLIKCVANEVLKYNIVANSFALPSIKTNKVVSTKPYELSDEYMTLESLVDTLCDTINSMSSYNTGNIISLVKYSDSFFHKSYYDRNHILGENGDA